MATFYGTNNNKAYQLDPVQEIAPGEAFGRKRILYDEFVCAQDVYAIADIIKMGRKLPKGARILNVSVLSPSLGSTGIFTTGNAVGAGALHAADADSLIPAADAGGQAVLGSSTAASLLLGVKLLEEIEMQLVFTEATDAADGKTIKIWVEYVLD